MDNVQHSPRMRARADTQTLRMQNCPFAELSTTP
jgi:hypothetical protein